MDYKKIFQVHILGLALALLLVDVKPVLAQDPGESSSIIQLFDLLDEDNWAAARETITWLDWIRLFVSEYFGETDSNPSNTDNNPSSSIDLTENVQETLSPVESTLSDFNAVVNGGYETTAQQLFGINWNTVTTTTQAYEPLTAAGDYYDDPSIPDELRDTGYSLESLSDVDTSTMSPLDYSSYLGAVVAIPFLYVRGFGEIAEFVGPIGLFVTWLLIAAVWVTLVNFLAFLLSTASSIFSVGSRILQLIGLVKP